MTASWTSGRYTNSSGHLPALDGIRGIAILMVIFHHAGQRVPSRNLLDRIFLAFTNSSWVGVDLFFVLSGFLITCILVETKGSPKYFSSFYARRILRIFPLYYATLLLLFFFSQNFLADSAHYFQQKAWWYILYGSNLLTALEGWPPRAINHFWSLAVEEQFYLIWPFLVFFLSPRSFLRLCVSLMLLSPLLRFLLVIIYDPSPTVLYVLTPTRLGALAAGSGLAIWHRMGSATNRSIRFFTVTIVVSLAILGIQGALYWQLWDVWGLTFNLSLVAIACASLVGLSITSSDRSWLNRLLSMPLLTFFGKYSYAIYIFHKLVDNFARDHGLHLGLREAIFQSSALSTALYAISLAAVSSLIALISWNLLEKHFLNLKKYFPCKSLGPVVPSPAVLVLKQSSIPEGGKCLGGTPNKNNVTAGLLRHFGRAKLFCVSVLKSWLEPNSKRVIFYQPSRVRSQPDSKKVLKTGLQTPEVTFN